MSSITNKQLEANRKNAKLGGVKTEEGKSIVKYNAVKHGLLCQQVVIEGENQEEFIELEKKVRDNFLPKNVMEDLIVNRIITGIWRLRRVLYIEKNLMEWQKNKFDLDIELGFDNGKEQKNRQSIMNMIQNDCLEKLSRYETMLERSVYKAINLLNNVGK